MDSSHELETVTPSTVVESLRESLMTAGIVLPSLGIDPAPPGPAPERQGDRGEPAESGDGAVSAPPEPPSESWDDIAAQLHDLRERGEWAAQLSRHLTPGSPLLEFLAEAGEQQVPTRPEPMPGALTPGSD
ncbi:hypothetical protein ACLF6K_20925 [Streptomyces xanthophaeus]|uniref:hypothetical protein n=1 Tax=Streptomyces xanthophaeus TaxID=67385 RepID=UPI0039903239